MVEDSKLINGANIKFKMLAAFSQISTNISFNCGVEFPVKFNSFLALTSFVNLDMLLPSLGFSCMVG